MSKHCLTNPAAPVSLLAVNETSASLCVRETVVNQRWYAPQGQPLCLPSLIERIQIMST